MVWSREMLLKCGSGLRSLVEPGAAAEAAAEVPECSVECEQNIDAPEEAAADFNECREEDVTECREEDRMDAPTAPATLDAEHEKQQRQVDAARDQANDLFVWSGVVNQCPSCYELLAEISLDASELSDECQQHLPGILSMTEESGELRSPWLLQWCDKCVRSFCPSCTSRTEFDFRLGQCLGIELSQEQGDLVVIGGLQKVGSQALAHVQPRVGVTGHSDA
ncbi:unnamed protein product [Polarella glacialis]|uniref:Uncharacterized protein n=1 Tax=Polarella glacialis TaxID=89957 RepID=A0A813EJK0_POLGL|nr:unnamed protein product [Polarella glacialis]